MKNNTKIALASFAMALAASPEFAQAQSSVTVYGILDVFGGYQNTTVGGKSTSLTLMGNNGELTSRLGFRGVEDLGGGYRTSFNLETGFDPSTGAQQNTFRLFDRQAWLGIGGDFGEARMGRQNTPMFAYSGNMDAFGAATYGSAFNDFSNWLARIDNDVSYISPKFANSNVEVHYSFGEKAGVSQGGAAYQAAFQTQQGPFYLGTAFLKANNATNTVSVKQFMLGGNYDYGAGKVYLGFFRTDDIISATTGNALSNPAGKYDPAIGPVGNVPGNYHNTYSVSADYRILPTLTMGAGGGYISDGSSLGNSAKQFSVILNYDLSKRTRIYSVVSRLINSNTAAFKMTGASVTAPTQLLSPDGGASETGFQVGLRHTF